MIEVKNLHLKLARQLGDYITPEGAEFVNGDEDGIRYTYSIRKSAIENAIASLVLSERIKDIEPFRKEALLNLVNQYQIDNYIYEFNLPSYIKIHSVQILNYEGNSITNSQVVRYFDGVFYPIPNWLVGLGVYLTYGSRLLVILPSSIGEGVIKCRLIYYSAEGMGEVGNVLNVDSGLEDLIVNLAYSNIISKEVVKK